MGVGTVINSVHQQNHITLVQRRYLSADRSYHDYANLLLMVLLLSALQCAENTMKYTIDDADYIINWIFFIVNNQHVVNSSHSHSIINKPFLSFIFNSLFSC